jgi:Phage terminase-like protein, large subunit
VITELIARIVQYAEDIVDERITACKKHKQACERFLNEIELIPNDDYPYYFDGDELYRFYRWARMFKHTKGILAGQPIELTDFQLFVVGNILHQRHIGRPADRIDRFSIVRRR